MRGLCVQCYWCALGGPQSRGASQSRPCPDIPIPRTWRGQGTPAAQRGAAPAIRAHRDLGAGCCTQTQACGWRGGEALLGPPGLGDPQTAPGSPASPAKVEPRALRCAVPCPSSLRLPRCPPTSCTHVLASHTRVRASPHGASGVQWRVAFPHELVGAGIHGVGHRRPSAHPGQ